MKNLINFLTICKTTLFTSIRLWVLIVPAILVLVWYYVNDPNGGAETVSRLQYLSWIIVIALPVYLVRRAFFPEARSRAVVAKAMEHPIGAGLVFLGLAILTAALFLALAGRAGSM